MRAKGLLIFLLLLSGCAGAAIENGHKELSVEDTYKEKCGLCHRPLRPQDYGFIELEAYVKKYAKGITDKEKEALLRFLKENAKEE